MADELETGLSWTAKALGIFLAFVPLLGWGASIATTLGLLETLVGAAATAEPEVAVVATDALALLDSHKAAGTLTANHVEVAQTAVDKIEAMRQGTAPHPGAH